jgi:5-methylcytosine-specific restriction endonuclease McrA
LSTVNCKYCQDAFEVPPSKIWRSNFCSQECRIEYKNKELQSRKRYCKICCSEFTPRLFQIKTGNGKYCSKQCRNIAVLPELLTPESKLKSKTSYMLNLKDGKITHPKGKEHPRWSGGQAESISRRIKSGKANQTLKKYRANNLDKVREWSQTRAKRKTGRLPNGTVKNILKIQEYKCAICFIDVSNGYHVDHIFPLSKGGKHEPSNIQILCPPCNLRKAAKIPARSY